MAKKQRLTPPYIGIEEYNGKSVLFSEKGEYSVVMQITNPVKKYSSNTSAYYSFSETITNLIKTLGAGYAIQKHDIFTRLPFTAPSSSSSYLEKKYFEYFEGRVYTAHQSYLTITREGKGVFDRQSLPLEGFFLTRR